jgi:hypothetical protein
MSKLQPNNLKRGFGLKLQLLNLLIIPSSLLLSTLFGNTIWRDTLEPNSAADYDTNTKAHSSTGYLISGSPEFSLYFTYGLASSQDIIKRGRLKTGFGFWTSHFDYTSDNCL